jgi:UDP-2-acetamido-2,6-beta-L-arabino-hexul-4-ose reductase
MTEPGTTDRTEGGGGGAWTCETLTVHADARGLVLEPMEAADLRVHRNVHAAITRPGQVRGNHYHRLAAEVITVTGPALVRLRDRQGRQEDVRVPEHGAVRLRLPPGTAHAVKNTGRTDTLLVAMSTELHDPEAPDTVRVELLS